jgi:protein-S-isoprenylcysteine O-methyltransferase
MYFKVKVIQGIMEPLRRNYIIVFAFAESMYWRNVPLTRTGLVFVFSAILLKASVYSIEYIAMQANIILKRSELEKPSKYQKQLESALLSTTCVGWIGYCLLLNGLFTGLFCLWMLFTDQIYIHPIPKLTVAVKGMEWFSQSHSKQSVFHRGVFLGTFTGLGIVLSTTTSAKGMGMYLIFISIFHFLEYVCIAINTTQVTLSAFLLNHSAEYNVAIIASILEYLVEWYFFPFMKSLNWITNLAIMLSLGGQLLRSCAMLSAKSNFTHIVRRSKVEGHQLVKTGVYRYFRHPSYTGFFYWAVFLQLVLMNPICFLAYIKTLANFFSDRILTEEESLIEFFGQDYIEYRKDTWLLIPEI